MLRIFTRCLQAVTVRPLSSVSALVRFAEEPQMFAIEFSDGCPIHVSFCCAILVCDLLCYFFSHAYCVNCRFMQAHLVIAYLQQFVMLCKLK